MDEYRQVVVAYSIKHGRRPDGWWFVVEIPGQPREEHGPYRDEDTVIDAKIARMEELEREVGEDDDPDPLSGIPPADVELAPRLGPFRAMSPAGQQAHLRDLHGAGEDQTETAAEHDANHQRYPHLHAPYGHLHVSAAELRALGLCPECGAELHAPGRQCIDCGTWTEPRED